MIESGELDQQALGTVQIVLIDSGLNQQAIESFAIDPRSCVVVADNGIGILGDTPLKEHYSYLVIQASNKHTSFGSTAIFNASSVLNSLEYLKNIVTEEERQGIASPKRVVNMSFAGLLGRETEMFREIQDRINWLSDKGVIFVAGAGNSNSPLETADDLIYPAGLEHVITAGGSNPLGDRWVVFGLDGSIVGGSNYGANLFAILPAEKVLTLSTNQENNENGVAEKYGTSLNAPQLTEIIAIIRVLQPELTAEEITAILALSTVPAGETPSRNDYVGYGVPNMARVLEELGYDISSILSNDSGVFLPYISN